jgi:hypothetical protein
MLAVRREELLVSPPTPFPRSNARPSADQFSILRYWQDHPGRFPDQTSQQVGKLTHDAAQQDHYT